jgi:hypothetical protein
MIFDPRTQWRRLYAAAALAGAAAGFCLALGLFPATPPRVAAWVRSSESAFVPPLVTSVLGALIGLILTAVAHLGVHWQLRRRS